VVALDGIAIVVNRANPAQSLTRAQIGGIFKGAITDWSQVGGTPGPIRLFSRDTESGTFDSFVSMVLAGDKKAISPSSNVKANGEDIADAVAADADAIGFVGIAQVRGARALAVSDGPGTTELLPTTFSVSTEDYILSRRLFLYTGENPSKEAEKFVKFALDEEGQKVVKKVGYVPLEASLEKVSPPDDAPADYRSLTEGKKRMRLNFRFRPNVAVPDTKALRDLQRVEAALTGGDTVYLLGFADSKGSPEKNRELSQQRAEAIAKELGKRDIKVAAYGLSSEMPVADNRTAAGREKNRRVEVWVR
jgi:phosphate transport system substrate-binding protein